LGTPASSTTKTGRHEIAEILLKVALNTKIKSNQRRLQLVKTDDILFGPHFIQILPIVTGENHRPWASSW
jgi:hypothetical protein